MGRGIPHRPAAILWEVGLTSRKQPSAKPCAKAIVVSPEIEWAENQDIHHKDPAALPAEIHPLLRQASGSRFTQMSQVPT